MRPQPICRAPRLVPASTRGESCANHLEVNTVFNACHGRERVDGVRAAGVYTKMARLSTTIEAGSRTDSQFPGRQYVARDPSMHSVAGQRFPSSWLLVAPSSGTGTTARGQCARQRRGQNHGGGGDDGGGGSCGGDWGNGRGMSGSGRGGDCGIGDGAGSCGGRGDGGGIDGIGLVGGGEGGCVGGDGELGGVVGVDVSMWLASLKLCRRARKLEVSTSSSENRAGDMYAVPTTPRAPISIAMARRNWSEATQLDGCDWTTYSSSSSLSSSSQQFNGSSRSTMISVPTSLSSSEHATLECFVSWSIG